jgi:hypothetical protein
MFKRRHGAAQRLQWGCGSSTSALNDAQFCVAEPCALKYGRYVFGVRNSLISKSHELNFHFKALV